MANELDDFFRISDVSYLLTRLRMATKKNDTPVKEAIIERLREIGVLKKAEAGENVSFRNIRTLIAVILGEEGFL